MQHSIDILLCTGVPNNPSTVSERLLFNSFPVKWLELYTNLDVAKSLAEHQQKSRDNMFRAFGDMDMVRPLHSPGLNSFFSSIPYIVIHAEINGNDNIELHRAEIHELHYETFLAIAADPAISVLGDEKDIPITRTFQRVGIAQKYGMRVVVEKIEAFLGELQQVPSINDTMTLAESFPDTHADGPRARRYLVSKFVDAFVDARIVDQDEVVAQVREVDESLGWAVEVALTEARMKKMGI